MVIPTGIISSPSYPSNYPSNSNCTWNVRVTVGRTVNVQFNGTFNIPSTVNCSSDYVQVSILHIHVDEALQTMVKIDLI